MYNSLNDAAAIIPSLAKGSTQVWYVNGSDDNSRDFSLGAAFAEKRGKLPKGIADLAKTHVLLGEITETDPEAIFVALQGENWSPEGEARNLIAGSGSWHTSMSVGDVVVIGGKMLMVDRMGFTEFGEGIEVKPTL